jgi:hypothetical protein
MFEATRCCGTVQTDLRNATDNLSMGPSFGAWDELMAMRLGDKTRRTVDVHIPGRRGEFGDHSIEVFGQLDLTPQP